MTEMESFAVELSREAARVALPFFRGAFAQEDKGVPGAFDPVTEADRAAEAAIRRLIAARYPDHGVIGEEYGQDRPDAEHVWVLDPIDGTAPPSSAPSASLIWARYSWADRPARAF